MKLHEITLRDIQLGRNWLLAPPRQDWSVKFLQIEGEFQPLVKVTPQDQVLYSALVVTPSGRVTALLMFKTVGDVGYGGVYWAFENGRWKLLGEEPDPNYEPGTRDFVADPLAIDPSFDADDHDYRKHHRVGFAAHVAALVSGSTQ